MLGASTIISLGNTFKRSVVLINFIRSRFASPTIYCNRFFIG